MHGPSEQLCSTSKPLACSQPTTKDSSPYILSKSDSYLDSQCVPCSAILFTCCHALLDMSSDQEVRDLSLIERLLEYNERLAHGSAAYEPTAETPLLSSSGMRYVPENAFQPNSTLTGAGAQPTPSPAQPQRQGDDSDDNGLAELCVLLGNYTLIPAVWLLCGIIACLFVAELWIFAGFICMLVIRYNARQPCRRRVRCKS